MQIDIGLTTALRLVPDRARELREAGFDGVFTAEAAQGVESAEIDRRVTRIERAR